MKNISRKLKHLVVFPLCALFFFIGVVTVHATTYYVATTGSNSNNGTAAGTPFVTIQKCIDVMVAGDTCTVADGTYTDVDNNGIVGLINTPNANGTAANPITLKSTNPLGAHITVPSKNATVPTTVANIGIYISRSYWIVEGFDISGGTATGTGVSHVGISFIGGWGSVARNNAIHGIGRTVCSESDYSMSGVYMEFSTGAIVENNRIYAIGRLRNGESGCSTMHYQHDHGIYVKGTTGTTLRRNVIYDANRGYPIHVYGGTATNLSIYHNTMAGKSPTGLPVGQLMLASTVTTANIKNNISYDAGVGMIDYFSLTASGVMMGYNLSDTLEKTGTHNGVTFSNNLQNTNPDFVDAAGKNFHLNASSPAINAGTNVGFPFQGTAPDIGAYEFPEQGGDITPPLIPINLAIQ